MRTLCTRDGSHLPTLQEVSANLRAGTHHVRQRDLPDVDGWADLCAAPELVHRRLLTRLNDGRCPSIASIFPLPKPGKSEVRKMAWLDPYDELYFRIVVGRIAIATDRSLGRDVYSYRLEDHPPGWTVQRIQQASTNRRDRGLQLLADERCNAMAVSDIRNYYPSISPEVIQKVLAGATFLQGAVRLIVRFLRESTTLDAPSGLPIGPEASGLLGNIVLLGVDRAVAGRVLGHVRYTDDSWLFLRSERDWIGVYDIYSESLSALDLQVNNSKVELYSKGSGNANHAIQHGHIAYLVSGAGGYRTPEMTAQEIRLQVEQDQPDWVVIKFLLGSLRHRGSSEGLPILYDYPNLLHEIPLSLGYYLSNLAENKKTRKKIDHDWLIEQVTASHTPRSLAGQLQMCRVASRLQTGKEHGQRFEELATDYSLKRHVPLQAWAARAWGSSKAHSPSRAMEHICHLGNLSVRRAFALTIFPKSSTRSKRSAWKRKLMSVDADLAPTLARLD